MNKLPLSDFHAAHADTFVEIGGYQIPARYRDPVDEFVAAHTAVIMDRSYIGKLRVFGKDRVSLLHRLTTNEMRNLKTGEGIVNILTTPKGRIVDVVEMFMEADDIFMLTTPGRAAVVKEWIEKYTFIEDVRCENVTAEFVVFTIFGKESVTVLRELLAWTVESVPAQHAKEFVWDDVRVWAHRTGSLTPAEFNLIVPAAALSKFWKQLTSKMTPIGYAAYEMLRIHRGLPAVEKEITENYNPHEVGLFPFINFEKGCYIGQEVIARLDTYQKIQRQLMGVHLETETDHTRQWPVESAEIYAGEQLLGQLTSICFSPVRGHAIGLAIIRKQFATLTNPVQIRWPGKTATGRLQPLPFSLQL
jgi:hypothetical protein